VEAVNKIVSDSAVLFDMDGVLVDVSESYRKTIMETVKFFSGELASPEEIQHLKEQGGYNNDWDLTEALLKTRDKNVPKPDLIKKFQELYLGAEGKRGFIENEKWLLPKESLQQLRGRRRLGIVTGRPRYETFYVLRKFGVESLFDVIIVMEDYPPENSKPNPYPIELALRRLGTRNAVCLGDGVDDIVAAKRAGLRVFGCLPPHVSGGSLGKLLLSKGAEKVLFSAEEIVDVLV
jgi:HAD superfamily hydrolase (TIGR01548 family)